MDHQIDRAGATNPCLVVKPLAAGDHDVVEIALRAKCRAFSLGLETIAFQHFTERNATHLIGESGDFHLLTGHPIARRASLKVALTSSGKGHSVGFAGWEFFTPRSLRLWWRVVRGEAELGLVLGKFPVELLCPFVKTLPDGKVISFRSSETRRSRMIFVVSDKTLGGGAAVHSALNGLVPEEVAGTFPL